ncbi:HD family hydrolase [Brevundimonas sp. 2R-24]|uniref:HD family hydrolase n=1 Tax=Peiella sedimenti TaxID=3061083 RepID=A0ABT8SIL8_9CAUL|nr:HD family hydrolase [Caulobacteraceae bacterium XZ-24]
MPSPAKSQPPRAWQRMLSGRRLDLLDPSPMDIEIEDIAHGLARVARWNGQTTGPHAFSVAEHSVIVERIVGHIQPDIEARWRLTALLHDASEYVIGDMISPFKAALGVNYKDFEGRLEHAIQVRFGLPPRPPATIKSLIKKADRACAFFEATQLAGFSHSEALGFFGRPPPGLDLRIEPLEPVEAQARYLARFQELMSAPDLKPQRLARPRPLRTAR